MNTTEQVMEGIKSQYYWIDEYQTLGHKDVIHGLIIFIAVVIIICVLIWYRGKNPGVII